MIKVILKEHVLKETYAVPLSKSGLPPIVPVSLKASYSCIIWKLRIHSGHFPLPYPHILFFTNSCQFQTSLKFVPLSLSLLSPSWFRLPLSLAQMRNSLSCQLHACCFLTNLSFFLWQPEFFRNIHLVITYLFKTIQQPPTVLEMMTKMFTLDAKSWPVFLIYLLPFSLLSTIQFQWFLDFSKLLSSMSPLGLCTFCALLETFLQPHYMLYLFPLLL